MTKPVETILVPQKANLPEAEALVAEFQSIPDDRPIAFDCSKVTEMSTPYVIAIVSILHSRKEQAQPIVAISPPADFIDAFSDLGLFQDLMKMEFQT